MKQRLLILCSVLWLAVLQVRAQEKTVTGTITDPQGEGLPGVSVILKGTTTGTITDVAGKFTLKVTEGNVLIFQSVGFTTQEITVTNQTSFSVQMQEDVQALKEVVVVGYGTQLKTDVTGSIASVTGEEIANVPVPSFESAIQGRVAGAYISSGSGKVGQGIKIRVRGGSSVTASSQPLYVVDGVPITTQNVGTTTNEPINPLANINTNDIESIEILKDASAAAIYGSRAANGVVLITTKRGKEGKTNINLGYSVGFSDPTNKRDFLNGEEYLELLTEAYNTSNSRGNSSLTQRFSREELFDLVIPGWDGGYNTNWQDKAFQQGFFQQADLSMSGGNAKTQFYVSGSYLDQDGILVNNSIERFSGKIALDHMATEKLKVGLNIAVSRTDLGRVSNDNAFATPLQLVALPPVQPAIDPATGDLNQNTVYYNGLIEQKYADSENIVFRNLTNLYANYTIVEGLSFRSEFGLDLYDQTEEIYQGKETQDGAPAGLASSRAVRIVNYNTNNFFNYAKVFEEKHDIGAVVGMSYQQSNQLTNSQQARTFPNGKFRTLGSAASNTTFGSLKTSFSFLSYFTRLNYKFDNKYLVSLSGRIDGSSRFGANNRYGFFPAASVGWIMSNESFLQDNTVLSFLKLRSSIGVTGNAEIGNFDYLPLVQATAYGEEAGTRFIQLPNPDLKWETTTQWDVGVDFGFLNDRITGEIDYYIKNTTDLLLNENVAGTSGFQVFTRNVGELENKGIEFVLNTKNLVGDFTWETSFNISGNRNKIKNLNGSIIDIAPQRAVEGQPIGVFFLREYAGVDPANGDALYKLNDGSGETTNNYGAAQRVVVGDPNPGFIGGLNNSFSYKNFDLSIFLQFVNDVDVYNGGGRFMASNFNWFDNQTADQKERWQNPGDVTDVPQLRLDESNGNNDSSRWIEDASYLRVKNIVLGYNFSQNVLTRLHLNNLRVYAM